MSKRWLDRYMDWTFDWIFLPIAAAYITVLGVVFALGVLAVIFGGLRFAVRLVIQ